jgi:hypothetical protein
MKLSTNSGFSFSIATNVSQYAIKNIQPETKTDSKKIGRGVRRQNRKPTTTSARQIRKMVFSIMRPLAA